MAVIPTVSPCFGANPTSYSVGSLTNLAIECLCSLQATIVVLGFFSASLPSTRPKRRSLKLGRLLNTLGPQPSVGAHILTQCPHERTPHLAYWVEFGEQKFANGRRVDG